MLSFAGKPGRANELDPHQARSGAQEDGDVGRARAADRGGVVLEPYALVVRRASHSEPRVQRDSRRSDATYNRFDSARNLRQWTARGDADYSNGALSRANQRRFSADAEAEGRRRRPQDRSVHSSGAAREDAQGGGDRGRQELVRFRSRAAA